MPASFQQTTIPPGLLVGCSTSVTGNVKYSKIDLAKAKITETGGEEAEWQTKRTVINKAEQDAATKLRSECRGAIAKICTQTAFGLLCRQDRKDELDAVVAEARKLCSDFNAKSQTTTIKFNVIYGNILPDDREAVNAINAEVRQLLFQMEEALKERNYEDARKASSALKSLSGLLSQDAQVRIGLSLDAVRAKANELAKAERDTGSKDGVKIEARLFNTIEETRTAFIDLEPTKPVEAPDVDARAIELGGSIPSPETEAA